VRLVSPSQRRRQAPSIIPFWTHSRAQVSLSCIFFCVSELLAQIPPHLFK
jgi:hypothetical protein